MSKFLFLLMTFAAPAHEVEVTLLDGSSKTGELNQVTATELQLLVEEDIVAVKRSAIMNVKLTANALERKPKDDLVVELADGGLIRCSDLKAVNRKLKFTSVTAGIVDIPQDQVRFIRMSAVDRNIKSAWEDIQQKELKNDILVVRKGDVLDYLTGVVGDISESSISFLLDNREVSVKREKVFAIMYYGTKEPTSQPVCEIRPTSGEVLPVKNLTFSAGEFSGSLLSGTSSFNIPATQVDNLDFSLGKVRYLSDETPREIQFTPYLDYPWEVGKNRNTHGTRMKIGRQFFNRGICIHSKTKVVYVINQKYSRLKSMIGIDSSINPYGKVGLTIKGDDRVLYEKQISGVNDEGRMSAPEALDLDLKKVRTLEITVDYGSDGHDLGDNLNFANARFIK